MAIPRSVRTCRVRPASHLGSESRQYCDRKGSVLRLTVKNCRDSIVEGNPAKFDIHFFSSGAKVGRFCLQATCEKDADCFVAATWGGEEIQQQLPIRGCKSGFFQQFSSGGRNGTFIGSVENACRKLPLSCTYWMAILPYQQNTIVLIQGNDRNRAAMREILPRQDGLPVHDLVGSNIPNKPLQVGRGRTHLMVHLHIRQLIRQLIYLLFLDSKLWSCAT